MLGNQIGKVNWFTDVNGNNYISNPSFYSSGSGTVFAQVINADNCSSNLQAVQLNLVNQPQTGTALQPLKICFRTGGLNLIRLDSLIVGAQTGGVWTIAIGSQQPAAAFNALNGTLNANGLAAGTYKFKYLIANTCGQAETTVEINIGNQPIANAGTDDIINCKKTEITLLGSPEIANISYEWKTPTKTIAGISITTQEIGAHTFIATDNASGCKSSSSINIKQDIEKPIISNISTVDAKCFNSSDGSIKISANVSADNLPLTYKINDGSWGTLNTISKLNRGDYTVTVQGKNFCTSSKTVIINSPIQFTEKISFPPCHYFIGNDVQFQLDKQGGKIPIQYVWTTTPKISLSCTNCATPKFIILDTSSFQIRTVATDASGCVAIDSFYFDKIKENIAPDVITPNGDGLNDVLAFPDLECSKDPTQFIDNEFMVINRWGTVVYQVKNYDNTWGGTNQSGQLLLEGTYFYVLKLNIGQGRVYHGSVLIIR